MSTQTKVYSPETSSAIIAAITGIMMGNNGYANIGNNPDVIHGVRAAGFTVILGRDLHGLPTYKGFTAAGVAAQLAEQRNMPKPAITTTRNTFDYEGAILARQERFMMDW